MAAPSNNSDRNGSDNKSRPIFPLFKPVPYEGQFIGLEPAISSNSTLQKADNLQEEDYSFLLDYQRFYSRMAAGCTIFAAYMVIGEENHLIGKILRQDIARKADNFYADMLMQFINMGDKTLGDLGYKYFVPERPPTAHISVQKLDNANEEHWMTMNLYHDKKAYSLLYGDSSRQPTNPDLKKLIEQPRFAPGDPQATLESYMSADNRQFGLEYLYMVHYRCDPPFPAKFITDTVKVKH